MQRPHAPRDFAPEGLISPGEAAPAFDLLAAGSGRRLSLQRASGRKLVFVFHLQGTAPTAQEINHAVRTRYASPEDVIVASIIDLSIVPPVYWMTVAMVLNSAYERARLELPSDVDPVEFIKILPDWNGAVNRAYGASRTSRAAAIVVVDEDSNVVGSYQGESPVEAVMELLS